MNSFSTAFAVAPTLLGGQTIVSRGQTLYLQLPTPLATRLGKGSGRARLMVDIVDTFWSNKCCSLMSTCSKDSRGTTYVGVVFYLKV